jgi:hypothetical protein
LAIINSSIFYLSALYPKNDSWWTNVTKIKENTKNTKITNIKKVFPLVLIKQNISVATLGPKGKSHPI